MLDRTLCNEELADIRAQLLMMLIRLRQRDAPAHIHALLLELLSGIQKAIHTRGK